MISNGVLDVFYLPDPHNKDKKRDTFLHQSRFLLEYMKRLIKSLQKGSKADKYVVQNLTCAVVYLSSTFSKALFDKVLTLEPLTAIGPEVYVSIMTNFFLQFL